MALQLSESPAGHIWRAQPNHTPQASTARWLLLGAVLVSGLIAGGFALFGAWPVLPFAGIEIFALWLALRHHARHADDGEEITLHDQLLRITSRNGMHSEVSEFHPYWVQLRFESAVPGQSPRLLLGSHGKTVEIGRLLGPQEKQALADTLRQQLQQVQQSEKPNQP